MIEDIEERLKALRTIVDQITEETSFSMFIDKKDIRLTVANAYQAMSIEGEPVGAEQVQEIIAACDVSATENSWSRGIIEMREERVTDPDTQSQLDALI